MKLILLSFAILVSTSLEANTGRFFGLLNTSAGFSDTGTFDDGTANRSEADYESFGLGFGAEYIFPNLNPKLRVHTGFIYEFERSAEHATIVNDTAAASLRDNLPKLQMTTVYANSHISVVENISILGGISYFMPKVDASGAFSGFDIDPGFGLQYGLDFKIMDNFFVQMLHRLILLDTKGSSYKGKSDLSNLSLLIGKEF